MSKSLGWRIPLILVVLAVALFYVYPPDKRINLGLDLRGGSHIIMQVETASALKYEMDLTVSRLSDNWELPERSELIEPSYLSQKSFPLPWREGMKGRGNDIMS